MSFAGDHAQTLHSLGEGVCNYEGQSCGSTCDKVVLNCDSHLGSCRGTCECKRGYTCKSSTTCDVPEWKVKPSTTVTSTTAITTTTTTNHSTSTSTSMMPTPTSTRLPAVKYTPTKAVDATSDDRVSSVGQGLNTAPTTESSDADAERDIEAASDDGDGSDTGDGGTAGSKTNVDGPESAEPKGGGATDNTTDEPNASGTTDTPPKSSTGMVAGIVVGVAVLLLLLIFCVCCFRKSNPESDRMATKGGLVVRNPLPVPVGGGGGGGGQERLAANTTYGARPDNTGGSQGGSVSATSTYDNANNHYDMQAPRRRSSAATAAAAAAQAADNAAGGAALYEEVSEDPLFNNKYDLGNNNSVPEYAEPEEPPLGGVTYEMIQAEQARGGGPVYGPTANTGGGGGGGGPEYAAVPMSTDRNRSASTLSNTSIYSVAEHSTPPRARGSTSGGTVYAQLTPIKQTSPTSMGRARGGSSASIYSVAEHNSPLRTPGSPGFATSNADYAELSPRRGSSSGMGSTLC